MPSIELILQKIDFADKNEVFLDKNTLNAILHFFLTLLCWVPFS